jgi:hypothetical protein
LVAANSVVRFSCRRGSLVPRDRLCDAVAGVVVVGGVVVGGAVFCRASSAIAAQSSESQFMVVTSVSYCPSWFKFLKVAKHDIRSRHTGRLQC